MNLGSFINSYNAMYGASASATNPSNALNEAISLSGTLLSILPLLILYLVFQRQFIQSIEMSGITGE